MFSDVSWQEMACDNSLSFRARLQILKEILVINIISIKVLFARLERDH